MKQERGSGSKSIYIIAAVMTIMLFVSASSGSITLTLLPYAFLPIGLVKPEFLLPAYFISSLSSNYFLAAQGIGFTRLLAVTIIIGVAIRLFARRKPLLSKWFINCAFIAAFTFISYLLGMDSDSTPFLIMVLNILVLIAMTNLSLEKDELIRLFRAILLAVLIATIYYLLSFIQSPGYLENGRLTIAEGVNEDDFAMMLGQLSAYSLAYMFFSKNTFVKIACLFAGVVNTYFILLTGSRSALIGISLGLILTLLISGYVQKRLTKRLIGIIILCIAVATVFYFVIEASPVLTERMNMESVVSSGGTRRWPRVILEIQYVIPNHLLFGVGPSAVNETIALGQYTDDPGSSHNFIISTLTQVGILGFAAYMVFFWKIIKGTISKLRTHEMLIIPLMLILTAVFNGIGEVIYCTRLFWNTLSLAVLCLSAYINENKLNIKEYSKDSVI